MTTRSAFAAIGGFFDVLGSAVAVSQRGRGQQAPSRPRPAHARHRSVGFRHDHPPLDRALSRVSARGDWSFSDAGYVRLNRQIGGTPVLAKSLCLVARSRPAWIGRLPVVGIRRLPGEAAMRCAGEQRPVDVAVYVRREAENPSALQYPSEPVEIDRADEAPLPVLLLRPRVGIEEIDPRQRCVRQPVEQLRRVVVVDAQIGERVFGQRRSSSSPWS